jgi:hypothetical protein
MTKVLQGTREDIVTACPDFEIIDCTQLQPAEFRVKWAQFRLGAKPILFLNPTDRMLYQSASPKKNQYIGWDRDIPKAWMAWIKGNKIQIEKLAPLLTDQLRLILSKGIKHLTFTPLAVDILLLHLDHNETGTVSKGLVNAVMAQLLLHYDKPQKLGAEEVAWLVSGDSLRLAARITEALGKPDAVRLATQIPSEGDAIRLMYYLSKVLRNKPNNWMLMLKTCWHGADQLKYEYKVACLLFTLTTLESTSLKTTTLSSQDSIDRMLDLYQLSGIPSSGFGR